MKMLYFVRHGESESNINSFVQSPGETLTENGIEQVNTVAKRFLDIPVDIILSSHETRAKMTAEIMAKEINKQVEVTNLLIEFVKPSVINRKNEADPEVIEIKKILKKNFHVPGRRHSDEETFEDLKKRTLNFFVHVSSRAESNILVVTHSVFMRMVMAILILGKDLTSHEYWKFFISLRPANTGITVIKFNGMDVKAEGYADIPVWELITWNDHSHLGSFESL